MFSIPVFSIQFNEAYNPDMACVFTVPTSYLSGMDFGISWFAESKPVPPKIIGDNSIPFLITKPEREEIKNPELIAKLMDVADFFHFMADIPYDHLGISGSILPGLQKSDVSESG